MSGRKTKRSLSGRKMKSVVEPCRTQSDVVDGCRMLANIGVGGYLNVLSVL